MRMGPVFFFTLLVLRRSAPKGRRRWRWTGIVRYAGGSSFSALTLSPAAQRLSASTYLGAGGALSLLEAGVWASRVGPTSGRRCPCAQPASVRGERDDLRQHAI